MYDYVHTTYIYMHNVHSLLIVLYVPCTSIGAPYGSGVSFEKNHQNNASNIVLTWCEVFMYMRCKIWTQPADLPR